jgi:hypothetical protein
MTSNRSIDGLSRVAYLIDGVQGTLQPACSYSKTHRVGARFQLQSIHHHAHGSNENRYNGFGGTWKGCAVAQCDTSTKSGRKPWCLSCVHNAIVIAQHWRSAERFRTLCYTWHAVKLR